MKARTITGILLFSLLSGKAPAQNTEGVADSIRLHLDSCLQILKKESLYANRVNWKKIRKEVYHKAAGAVNKAQTFEALTIAFKALDDKHAAYYQYDDQFRSPNPLLDARYTDSIKAAWARGPQIIHRMIGTVAYVNVPYLGPKKQEDIDKYANWLYDGIAGLQAHHPTGWIIDLRLNGGGNIRPMLAGLAPFFDEGVVSYYIDKSGQSSDEAAFKDGNYLMDGVVQAAILKKTAPLTNAKVAVLTGAGTASSGEITAAVFSQRANTRLFGDLTAGLANATGGFLLNENNTYFLISTAAIADPKKKIFPSQIKPMVMVTANEHYSDMETDSVVKAAMDWLETP